MQQIEILHKRNLFIYFTFTVSLIIYATTVFLGPYSYRYHFPTITLTLVCMIGVLFYFKVKPSYMRVLLLTVYNLTIVFLIIQSQHIITFYWFIFLLLMASIYRSTKTLILLMVATLVEVGIISTFFFDLSFFITKDYMNIYLFFLVFICLTGLFQMLYIRKIWYKTEQANLQKEHELESMEAYLRLFFKHAEDAIAVFDLDDKIIDVNPAFERLYGWTREECLGKALPLVPPKNMKVAHNRFEQLLQGQSFHLFETEDMRKDGTLFDAQISLSPIYNAHGEIVALSVISRDISVIKEHERLLVQADKLRLAGEIAAGVAHEIRNPMTVISGFVQMMNADEHSPYKMYTELIQSEIERIDLIISEFLVLSRPQAVTFKPLKLEDILTELQTLYSIECQNRQIECTLTLNDSHTWIHGNANQIKQVFMNLIKNAIEAIDQKGTIHIELCNDEGQLYIYIKDTGCGIPPHLLERIFEPFYTTKSKGTGLGMMITNKIVQEHKGSIKIRSKEHIGTEVLICFPNIAEGAL